MKRITASSVQYWLYAVLATKFGRQLSLERSSIARRYDVNRHDFSARQTFGGQGDRYAFAASVAEYLSTYLAAAGFKRGEFGCVEKTFKDGEWEVEVRIYLQYKPQHSGFKNDTVELSVAASRKKPAARRSVA